MADDSKIITLPSFILYGSTRNLNMPSTADLRKNVAVGFPANPVSLEPSTLVVGTLDLPATTDVKSGVQYDGATKTGTYAGGGNNREQIGGLTEVQNG